MNKEERTKILKGYKMKEMIENLKLDNFKMIVNVKINENTWEPIFLVKLLDKRSSEDEDFKNNKAGTFIMPDSNDVVNGVVYGDKGIHYTSNPVLNFRFYEKDKLKEFVNQLKTLDSNIVNNAVFASFVGKDVANVCKSFNLKIIEKSLLSEI